MCEGCFNKSLFKYNRSGELFKPKHKFFLKSYLVLKDFCSSLKVKYSLLGFYFWVMYFKGAFSGHWSGKLSQGVGQWA